MRILERDEILTFLNEMLEAERAGARVTLHMAREAEGAEFRSLSKAIHHDEARWCEVLLRAIRNLGGTPSEKTGAFYDKAMAIAADGDRLAFLNRGQGWVVRRLKDAL